MSSKGIDADGHILKMMMSSKSDRIVSGGTTHQQHFFSQVVHQKLHLELELNRLTEIITDWNWIKESLWHWSGQC
jgi:hypothetical protein